MKLSVQWIREFTDVDLSNEELVKRIGSQLGAIESVEDWSAYYSNEIIVGQIMSAEDHPDADKLGVYVVQVSETETRNLVAGDKTLRPGDKVGYIPPGAIVPLSSKEGNPSVISEREIRGKRSQGMLGSAKELLLSDNHDGVAKLDTDAPVGSVFAESYQLNDLIIDIENKMFTHRPDLFGILGLAREISGIQSKQFNSPEWYSSPQELINDNQAQELPVNVLNNIPESCERFIAVAIDGITVGPSNLMMQSMLHRVGIRPINNVVDASNFAMYVTAQPSHAFDYDAVEAVSSEEGAQIVVRFAEDNEELTLLDGTSIKLSNSDMVVATDQKVISLAGAMGGAETEVTNDTKRIILEVATWDLYTIRRTSYSHGIFSEAVTRYNKGQSPKQCKNVLIYVANLLMDVTGGNVASNVVDSRNDFNDVKIEVAAEFINKRLGSNFSTDEIAQILSKVELSIDQQDNEVLITVPFWRTDLSLKEDIVEEVGRLYGYDTLPVDVPCRKSFPNLRSDELVLKQTLRTTLAAAGAQEVWTYNFVSSKLLEQAGVNSSDKKQAYKIRNSLSPELEYMRLSILPSIASKINQNIRVGYDTFNMFEINKSHSKEYMEADLPLERSSVALVSISKDGQGGSQYYVAKKYLDHLFRSVGVTYELVIDEDSAKDAWSRSIDSNFATGRKASVVVAGNTVGFIGEFNSRAKRAFKLPATSAGFEIDISSLDLQKNDYKALSKYPKVSQDITLETPDAVQYQAVLKLVQEAAGESGLLKDITPVSIYRPDGGMRRISLRCVFGSNERTLSTKEVNQLVGSIVDSLSSLAISQI